MSNSSTEADVDIDLAVANQSHILQQEPHDSLPFPIGRMRIAPNPLEIHGESHHGFLLLLTDRGSIGLPLPLTFFLRFC